MNLILQDLTKDNLQAFVDYVDLARKLFEEARSRMKLDGIDEYYLIQANNKEATNFYKQFTDVHLNRPVILRKSLKS